MNEDKDEDKKWQDVWMERFGIVNSLAASMQTALQVFTPSDDKVGPSLTYMIAFSSAYRRALLEVG